MAFAAKLSRSFSTSSMSSQLSRAPVQVYGIDGRYALALYSAAAKQNKLDAVEKDLKDLQAIWHRDMKLRDYMCNPVVSRQEKKTAFDSIVKKQHYSDLTKNLFNTVADSSRYSFLERILKTFAFIMSAHRGEILCEITTAKALDEATLKEVNAAVQGFVKAGQKLSVTTKVDPSILGGMIISIGDKYVDMSIAHRIQQYTKVMEEAM